MNSFVIDMLRKDVHVTTDKAEFKEYAVRGDEIPYEFTYVVRECSCEAYCKTRDCILGYESGVVIYMGRDMLRDKEDDVYRNIASIASAAVQATDLLLKQIYAANTDSHLVSMMTGYITEQVCECLKKEIVENKVEDKKGGKK